MIYINQIGATELGRGETLECAIIDACKRFGPILESEINLTTQIDMLADGELYWTDEPQQGYND